jgi:uncharacterized protein (TIGR00369 family)
LAAPPLALDAEGVNALMRQAFAERDPARLARVVEIEPGRALVTQRLDRATMLRPPAVIAGPALMSLADAAAYILVLGHLGEVLMAVTSSLSMNFLRAAPAADLWADATLLRLGRRLAVMDVRLWTTDQQRTCAQASVTYALPG